MALYPRGQNSLNNRSKEEGKKIPLWDFKMSNAYPEFSEGWIYGP
jgi:hypothetical protein